MKISKFIRDLIPYQPGKPIAEVQRELGLKSVYKLASNENPLGPSPVVKEAIQMALDKLSFYPAASCYELTQPLADYYGVQGDHLAFGNGSEEIIDLLVRIFCEPGESVLTSVHSFLQYKISAQAARVYVHEVPMQEDLRFDLEALMQKLESTQDARLIFIANPNNPTGTYLNEREIGEFLDFTHSFSNTLVVLDEAYNEYVRASDYPKTEKWLNKYRNLMIIRTLSKVFGIAGLRLGVLMAHPDWLSYYQRVRKPFNVNSLAQVAGIAAVKDKDYLQRTQYLNAQGLDYYYSELESMGVKYWQSEANFVLIELPMPGAEAYLKLLKLGIIARPVAAYGLPNHLRLSVGLEEENRAAIDALKKIL